MMLIYNENIKNPSIGLLLKMIIMKNIVSINLLFVILFFNIVNVFGQFTNSHIIYNPYQNENPTGGRTIGGATVALSDSIPYLIDNPAGIGFNKQIKVFSSFQSSEVYIDFASSSHPDLINQRWTDYFRSGTISSVLPIQHGIPWEALL